ncbi:MAG: FtsX-like permease family protein [Gammaproteobacteria bacterium]|nr:FtsX-like permease family protein [Gammaproteobacteria bacterium]
MNILLLAWKMLLRDWRAGEVRALFVAIIVAVTSVTAVGLVTDKIRQALELQANELLGADLLVSATKPINNLVLPEGLATAETLQFPSMVMSAEQSQLVAVKAVSETYPLRGQLRISPSLFGVDQLAAGIPERGEIWVEASLLTALSLAVGDDIQLGQMQLTIAAVIRVEPDRAAGHLFSIAPRLLLNLADLEKTELVTPASRVQYNRLYSGDAERIAEFRAKIESNLEQGQRIQGIEDARPEVQTAVEKGARFLGLAALVSVLLSAVAVAMATRRYVHRHLDECAILRCLGSRQNTIFWVFCHQMIMLGGLASIAGVLLGYLTQHILIQLIASLNTLSLPASSVYPAVVGLLTGMATVLGFALPPLRRLKDVPTVSVFRRELGALPLDTLGMYVMGVLLLSALVIYQAGELTLGFLVVGGFIMALAVFALCAKCILLLVGLLVNQVGATWRFGMKNIVRRGYASMVQIVAFGVGFMVLLMLFIVKDDLLTEWLNRLPADMNNRFLINIQEEQVQPVNDMILDATTNSPSIYPMVRARLTAIDGQSVDMATYQSERAKHLLQREFNMSWGAVLPADNRITKGSWWHTGEQTGAQFSVESSLAETLNIKLGNTLTFNIAGEDVIATVSSFREVDWDSFNVNFYVIASPGTLVDVPVNYITSFYLPATEHQLLNNLVKQFPNITVIDVSAVLDQVRTIIDKVSQVVEYVFFFTLLSGLVVLYTALSSTQDERIRETAVLRTLGVYRHQIMKGLLIEYLVLGWVAGVVAATIASFAGYILAAKIFHIPYYFNLELWLVAMVVGTGAIGLAGYIGIRPVLAMPPSHSLRY